MVLGSVLVVVFRILSVFAEIVERRDFVKDDSEIAKECFIIVILSVLLISKYKIEPVYIFVGKNPALIH